MNDLIIGQFAPLFELPDVDGRLVRLVDFLGKIVLLNFWSCDCPWAALADRAIQNKLLVWNEQVTWVSIASNANESLEQIQTTARERALPWVLWDSWQQVAELYAGQTTPHIFVIDPHGVLQYHGGLDDTTFRQRTPTRSYAFEAVDALIKGELPPLSEFKPYGCTIVRFRPETGRISEQA